MENGEREQRGFGGSCGMKGNIWSRWVGLAKCTWTRRMVHIVMDSDVQ